MAKTRKQKEEIVKELSDNIKSAKSVVLTRYQGLKVNEIEELRDKMYEQNSKILVTKNSLLSLALKDNKLDDKMNVDEKEGPVAIAYSENDEVAPAKVLADFAKSHEVVEILEGLLGTEAMDAVGVKELAKLPAKDQMLAQTVATIKAPISGFVNALSYNLRGLVNVLKAAADKAN
ncbi:MAG: 50S ribosomal protein L10 [bacterium]